MKKFIGFICYFFFLTGLAGQDIISMLLLDENLPIPQQKVNGILLSICGPDTVTSIFKEEHILPQVTNGIVNLSTGSGTRLSPLNYDESIRQYYNSLPPDKRPTSESTLIVKIEVKLTSGKSIAFMKAIKFNTSVPLIKGDAKESVFLNEKGLNIIKEKAKTDVSPGGIWARNEEFNYQSNLSADGVIIEKLNTPNTIKSIFKSGSSELINGSNKINLDPSSEVNFISNLPGTARKFYFNPFSFGLSSNQVPIWTLDQAGFTHLYNNYRTSLNNGGLFIEDTSGDISLNFTPGVIRFTNGGQQVWNFNQTGFSQQYLNYKSRLENGGLYLEDTLGDNSISIAPGTVIFTHNGQPSWNFNQFGFAHQYENYKSRLEDAGLFIDDTTAHLASLVQSGHMSMSEGGIPFWNINKDGFVYNSSSNFLTSLKQGIITTTNPNNLFKTTFSPGGISIANNANFGWDFSPFGGSWKPDKDKSFLFNYTPGFGYNISDAISKRRLEASYAGFSGFFDSKNIFNLAVGTTGSPFLNMFRTNSSLAASLGLNSEAAGDFRLTGSAGTPYIVQTSVAGSNGQRPYVFITQDGFTPLAGIYIDAQGRGVVFGTLKNFNADHPLQAEKNIVYSSLEGPEAAAYCRGKAQMKGGKAFVPFPDHFVLVCAPEDMTIQATPRSISSKGLAITSISEKGFMVEELMGGGGTYEFFWEAKGIRKGFENYEVVRNKSEVMPAEFIKPVMDKN